MSRLSIPGTVYRRGNGKWTAQSPEVYDSSRGCLRRVSLGTFESEAEANAALLAFNQRLSSGSLDLSADDVRRLRLRAYLEKWLELVDAQVVSGDLAARTGSGYRSDVRLHISPMLGHYTVGAINHVAIAEWLHRLRRDKGLADRTVVRIYRTLHRSLEDAPLPDNPSKLPKALRPRVRESSETSRPDVDAIRAFLAHTAVCTRSTYLSPVWRLAVTTGDVVPGGMACLVEPSE